MGKKALHASIDGKGLEFEISIFRRRQSLRQCCHDLRLGLFQCALCVNPDRQVYLYKLDANQEKVLIRYTGMVKDLIYHQFRLPVHRC